MKVKYNDISKYLERQLFLLYGSDYDSLSYVSQKIVSLMGVSYEVESYNISDCEIDDVILRLTSIDFFSPKKIFILKNINVSFEKKITSLLKEKAIDENIKIIIYDENINTKSSIVKYADIDDNIISLPLYDIASTLCGEVVKNSSLDSDIKTSIANLPSNPIELKNELEKIFLYIGDNANKCDVLDNILSSTESVIFDMIDDIMSRKVDKSLSRYSDCIQGEIDPMAIFIQLYNYIIKITKSRINIDNKSSTKEDEAKKNGIFFKKYNTFYSHINIWSQNQLGLLLSKIIKIDKLIKENNISSVYILEKLIIDITLQNG
jgi:DNA polymerase III delta subunit